MWKPERKHRGRQRFFEDSSSALKSSSVAPVEKKCEWLESAIGDIVSTQEAAPEFSIRNYVLSPKTEEENIDRLDRQENCMVV